MLSFLASALADLSLALKQPLTAYCDIETTHDKALITKTGNYVTWLRVDGMQRMCERKDFDAITEAMRLDLSGALETKGHAIVGWYISDPDAALVEIERVNLNACRAIAREAGLQLDTILDERARLWPRLMRWEAVYFQVWTRTSVLTKEERKQLIPAARFVDRFVPRAPSEGDDALGIRMSLFQASRHALGIA